MRITTALGMSAGGITIPRWPVNNTFQIRMSSNLTLSKLWYSNVYTESNNNRGVGEYMIEWMAKDSAISANAGDHGSKCPSLGICNPKVTFYRDGYNLVLYPWETVYQGNNYRGAKPGLCKGGVLDQFHKGGMVMGYT
jgi:hypothetical protein